MVEDASDANDDAADVYSNFPSSDAIFRLLANERRRYVIATLTEHSMPITLADLADEVAIREYDAPLNEISPETVKRVYMALYHTHIPKLSEANLVEYEQSQDMVTLTNAITRVEPYLDLVDDEEQ